MIETREDIWVVCRGCIVLLVILESILFGVDSVHVCVLLLCGGLDNGVQCKVSHQLCLDIHVYDGPPPFICLGEEILKTCKYVILSSGKKCRGASAFI